MLFAQFKLKDSILRLSKLNNTIKDKFTEEDIERYKPKFFSLCLDTILATNEMFFLTKDYFYKYLKDATEKAIKETKNQKLNGCDFKEKINSITTLITENYSYNTDLYSLDYETRRKISSVRVPEEDDIKSIFNNIINKTDKTVNIFQPNCLNGKTLKIAKETKGFTTYGIESDEYYFKDAKKNVDRMAKGLLKGSKISNNAFDILFVQANIGWNITNTKYYTTRNEKILLQDTIKYLKPNGICIISIPYFRLYKDICILLAKNYKNIQIRKPNIKHFETSNEIFIIAQKKEDKELIEYTKLRNIDINRIEEISKNDIDKIEVPISETTIDLFRGSILDFDEMTELINKTKCYENFWDEQLLIEDNNEKQKPLLPFNVGQIGLILTSGCLNGVVNEKDGHKHLIKGRVNKKIDENREVINGKLEVKETISNKVEIVIVMPDGTFKTLA